MRKIWILFHSSMVRTSVLRGLLLEYRNKWVLSSSRVADSLRFKYGSEWVQFSNLMLVYWKQNVRLRVVQDLPAGGSNYAEHEEMCKYWEVWISSRLAGYPCVDSIRLVAPNLLCQQQSASSTLDLHIDRASPATASVIAISGPVCLTTLPVSYFTHSRHKHPNLFLFCEGMRPSRAVTTY
jgi:hypothetical protein